MLLSHVFCKTSESESKGKIGFLCFSNSDSETHESDFILSEDGAKASIELEVQMQTSVGA